MDEVTEGRVYASESYFARERRELKIAFGCDDPTEVTEAVLRELRRRGHEVQEIPTEQWPEVAHKVAGAVAAGEADQGVLFCWTGTGSAIVANKVSGVRAALVWDPWIAEGARRWNDANVLVMSSKRITPDQARAILDAWFGVVEPDPDEVETIARLRALDQERD